MWRPKETGEEVRSILYVGNSFLSFNNGIGWHVSRLHASANPATRLRATSVAITGGGLDWHDVESYLRPKAFGSYSFDEANNVIFNDLERLFDVVLMMDCSQCPIHPQLKATFRASAKRHSETVRKCGAKPAFLMTWAYQDRPLMTAELAEAYTLVGNDNDALVIPVGLAFELPSSEGPSFICTWTTSAIRPWQARIWRPVPSMPACCAVRRSGAPMSAISTLRPRISCSPWPWRRSKVTTAPARAAASRSGSHCPPGSTRPAAPPAAGCGQ